MRGGGRQGFLHPCFLILFTAQLGSSSRSLLALGSSTCRGGGALINVSFCSFTDYETGIMLHDKCSYTDAHILSHTHTQSQFFKFWLLFLCLTHIFLILMADFQKNRKIFLNFCVVVSVMGYQQQFLVGHNRVWLVTALDFHFHTAILSLYQW